MLNVSNLISQCAAAFGALRLRRDHLQFNNGEISGANMTDIATNRQQPPGRIEVFFDHRRTRSTVALIRRDQLFTFEVRRSEAEALQSRLAINPREHGHALAEFIGRWRQQ